VLQQLELAKHTDACRRESDSKERDPGTEGSSVVLGPFFLSVALDTDAVLRLSSRLAQSEGEAVEGEAELRGHA
jgi:hypothetical protein